jgi:DNA-directed RNA polymerase subunit K/omega
MTETPDSPNQVATAEPAEPPANIQSRFLFVDVAAQRAKQLRRGARIRLGGDGRVPHKLERAAMEEVKQRLIHYSVPSLPTPTQK